MNSVTGALCRADGIALIYPAAEFLPAGERGENVYHDHFTPAGCLAFARAFTGWYGREGGN